MFVCAECGVALPTAAACPHDGTQLSPIGEDLLLGTTIGAYRVARLLGVGGMGRVYKGVHPTIGSRVAIKVLSRECSDRRDLVDRFFSEARAVNLIRHESIVNVLDLATLPDGRPYIIMEYLDGAPLASIVETSVHRRTPLPLGGLARLCAEVLDALAAAHAKGVIHRDLKPDNIFITPAGRAKVLDFGIAKLSDTPLDAATRTGSLLGTPHYMSPEQAAGKPVDARADVYAMGVILYECATGAKPFIADSLFDLLRKHVEVPPAPPRALRGDLPPELEHVILTALAKAPDQRFSTAQAMSVALQHATQRLPPEAWAPITGGADGTLPRGWDPTPPQSWSSQRGQVVVASPTRSTGSRAGLYLALVAIVLVIGGITTAVVLGKAEKTPVVSGRDTRAEAPDPDDAEEARSAKPAGLPASANEAALAAYDQAVTALKTASLDFSPRAQKTLTDALVGVRKLPMAERNERLQKAAQRMAQIAAEDAAAAVRAGAPADPPPSNGWFVRHDLTPPFNPKRVDLESALAWGVAEARKNVPDAALTRIDVTGVYADGHIDLSLRAPGGSEGSLDLRFISPSHAKPAFASPRGAGTTEDRKCEFRVLVTASNAEIYDLKSDCKSVEVPLPRCSPAQLWKKITAKKPDLSDAVAELGYRSNTVNRSIRWFIDIEDNGDKLLSEMWADDCAK